MKAVRTGDEQETVIAGGAASSFTLVVTNDGNVVLINVTVEDTVNAFLDVTGVAVTPSGAGEESCDAPSQVVSCTIPVLAVGESVTITVDFAVDASQVETTVSSIHRRDAHGVESHPQKVVDDSDGIGIFAGHGCPSHGNASVEQGLDPCNDSVK